MKTRTIIVAASILAACDLHFTEPAQDTPARLFVSVSLTDSTTRVLQIHGILDPGHDSQGNPRSVGSEALQVMGISLHPVQADAQGRRTYRAEMTRSAELSTSERVSVRAPRVIDISGEPPQLDAPLVQRAGSDTLKIAPGQPLELRLRGAGSGSPPSGEGRWRVEIHDQSSGQSIASVQGSGAPPATIVIPSSWLALISEPGWRVRLSATQTVRQGASGNSYSATLSVHSALHWMVRPAP